MIEKIVWGFVILGGSLVVLSIADCAGGTTVLETVTVLDRAHESSRTVTGTGFDGKRTVVTTHYVPEQWQIIVQNEHGVRSVTVSAEAWAAAVAGQTTTVAVRVGASGHRWSESVP